jgi:hypothetical protein
MAGLTDGAGWGYEDRHQKRANYLMKYFAFTNITILFYSLFFHAPPAAMARPAPRPRLYLQVQDVKLSASVAQKKECRITGHARDLLTRELAGRPEVVTDLGGDAAKLKGPALERELKRRGLQGFGIVLRITACDHELLPPAQGKVYRVLMVNMGVAIDAEKIPSGQMALAGEGRASVGTEVSRIKEKERKQLLKEATGVAIKQAVDRTIAKTTKPAKRRKRGTRRRGRHRARQ